MSPAGSADLSRLVEQLGRASRDITRVREQALDDAAQKISERMQQLAPKRTGRLAASIRIQSSPGQRVIGPVGVEYAVYQEYGTATRGEFGGQPYVIKPVRADRLVFKINGRWISTKMVIHPGIPPHPYVRPALQEYLDNVPSDLVTGAVNLIKGKS